MSEHHTHHHDTEAGDDQHYEKTSLERAREELETEPGFIDLIDTNFHRNGLLYPADLLSRALAGYPETRPYAPDPRGALPAREAIAAYYRGRGLEVTAEQIIITASASEGYNLLFNRMLEHGQTVSLPRPVYPLFEVIAEFNHLGVEHYTLDLDRGAQPDPRRLAAEVSEDAGLLVAISPNNPTGTCLERPGLQALVDLARDRGLPLLFDEVFSEFVFSRGPDHPPDSASHTAPPQIAEDVLCITLNGISKMFACPDLKLSWLLVTGPADLREELLSVLEIANDMYLNASSVSQAVLPSLFAEGRDFQREMVAEVGRRRDLCLSMTAASAHLEPVVPDGGIHCVLRVRGQAADEDDEELAERLLRETGVYTHPGYLYDLDEETALVVSFLKEPAALEEGLGRITRWFAR
jgi:aspartate/methionine/tyrosine aminotransferase